MKYTKESLFKQCKPNFPRVSLVSCFPPRRVRKLKWMKLTFNMLKFNSTATSGEHINIFPNLQWIRCPLQPLRMENTLSEVGMNSKITHICALCHFSLVEELTFEWKVFVLLNLEDTEGCKTKKDKTRRGKTTKRQDQEKFGWTIPSCSGS